MAIDVDKANGRKPVEHERTSHQVASTALHKSAHEETLSMEMPVKMLAVLIHTAIALPTL